MKVPEMTQKICKAASDKKADRIVSMDMRNIMFSTDCFVICSARTVTQVKAITDNIENELDKFGVHFIHREGYQEGGWVLLDYGDVVVHIFLEENREYYSLEQLWSEAKIEEYTED